HGPDDQVPQDDTAPTPAERAQDCAFHVRMAALDPPVIRLGDPDSGSRLDLLHVPGGEQIDRTMGLIAAVEQTLAAEPDTPTVDRLMDLACLSALYERAATDLTLASQGELGERALGQARRARGVAARLLDAMEWDGPEGRAALKRLASRFSGRSWLLL